MKTNRDFYLAVFVLIGFFIALPYNAHAGFPRVVSALDHLEAALKEADLVGRDDGQAKISDHLESALKLLQISYDSKSGFHARAIKYVRFAIDEEAHGDPQHLTVRYIKQAIADTKAALADYSVPHKAPPPPSN